MKKLIFPILAASFFFLKAHAETAAMAKPPVAASALPIIRLALPDKISPAITWVSPPIDPKQLQAAQWKDLLFSVGPTGQTWIGHDRKVVADAISEIQFELSQPYVDFAYLKNGVLLFCTDKEIGVIPKIAKLKDSPSGRLVAPFQPLAAVPIENCRLFPSESGALYITGYNKGTSRYEAYRIPLRPGSIKGKTRYQWEFRRIFSSADPIQAVAGDGHTTYAAIGPLIVKINDSSGASEGLFRHPVGPILYLALAQKAGLFYATDSEVGFINPEAKYSYDFFKSPHSQLALSGNHLYIMLGDSLGIFRLDHLGRFALSR